MKNAVDIGLIKRKKEQRHSSVVADVLLRTGDRNQSVVDKSLMER